MRYAHINKKVLNNTTTERLYKMLYYHREKEAMIKRIISDRMKEIKRIIRV